MSLINCPECGKEVSDQATNCIYCGCPIKSQMSDIPKMKKAKSKKIIISLLIFLFLIVIATAIFLSIYFSGKNKVSKLSSKADSEVNVDNSPTQENNLEQNNAYENTNVNEEEEYIKNYLRIESAEVASCEGILGTEPGIRKIQVRNNGDRSVIELSVTVSLYDNNSTMIAEKTIMLIGGLFSSGEPLKPNYVWKSNDDEYYALENLPSGISLERSTVHISSIKFE